LYETVPIDLGNKPPEFLEVYSRANPIPGERAKVPVLEVEPGGLAITESLIVTDYLAEAHPEAGLMPSACEDRALVRLFSEVCGSSTFAYWSVMMARNSNNNSDNNDDETSEAFETAVAEFTERLVKANAFLEARASRDGPFLFGERFTLAECNAAPFVQRACNVLSAYTGEKHGCPSVDPMAICEARGLTRLQQWMAAVLAHPSVKSLELSSDEMNQSVNKMLQRFADATK